MSGQYNNFTCEHNVSAAVDSPIPTDIPVILLNYIWKDRSSNIVLRTLLVFLLTIKLLFMNTLTEIARAILKQEMIKYKQNNTHCYCKAVILTSTVNF